MKPMTMRRYGVVPLGAEQVLDVLFAEEIPADDGRESEEEQADCHKGDAKGPEAAFKSLLGQSDAGGGAVDGVGHEDDEGCHIQHDKGIHENADDGDKALLGGILHLGDGMGVRGGAHARLVGEQAARHAVAHGFLDARADDAAVAAAGSNAPTKTIFKAGMMWEALANRTISPPSR